MSNRSEKWQRRPLLAGFLRILLSLIPIAISILLVSVLGRAIPRPEGWLRVTGWWVGLSIVATGSLIAVDRLVRRFLPLVALLNLSLVFPDRAPSRFSVALRTGTVRQLKRNMESGDFSTTAPQEAAEQLVGLASALNAHDRMTRGHTERVRAYSVMIGEELGLSDDELELVNWSGLVHDIGKLTVPVEILNKPGKPSEEEWQILRGHPEKADALIEPLRSWLGEWAESATQHHERFDGKGYPAGLAGHDITLAGRIVAIADAYDVMTSTRSYKKPMSAAAARKELAVNAGGQFDPDIVRSFLRVSIGRLQLVAGPLGSLLQLPAGSASVGTVAATGASAVTTIVVASAVGLVSPPPELAAPIPETVAMVEVVETQPDLSPVAEFEPIVEVLTPNAAPVAAEDVFSIAEDETGDLLVLANDSDVDGDDLVVTSATLLAEASSLGALAVLEHNDRSITIRALPNEWGTAVLEYTIADPEGAVAVGRAHVGVRAVNDAPLARSDTFDLLENTAQTLDVLANDVDIDGDQLLISTVRNVAGGTATTDGRSIQFTPSRSTTGAASVTYVVEDGNGASSSARVGLRILDDPLRPALVSDTATTTEDITVTIDVLANDLNGGIVLDASSLGIDTAPTNGTINVVTGRVVFTPDADWFGTDTFVYSVCDAEGFCGQETATVTVEASNDAPTFAVGPNLLISEDSLPQTYNGWLRDLVAGPANESPQTVSLTVTASNPALFTVQPAIATSGDLTYTPAADANGTSTISVVALDSGGTVGGGIDTSETLQATITITPVNDQPHFVVGADPVAGEDAGSTSRPLWATGIGAGPSDEASQAVTFEVTASNAGLFSALPMISPLGHLSFTPAADANGSSVITIELVDDGGTNSGGVDRSASATATIFVTAQNDAPVTAADSGAGFGTATDTAFTTSSVLANDIDIDSSMAGVTVDIVTPPTSGALTNNGDGTFDFAPAAGWDGTETFTYQLTDTGGAVSNTATVTIVVQIAPVADAGGPYAIAEGDSLVLDGSASTDAAASWQWDLDNDGAFDDAVGQSPTIVWATLEALGVNDDGTYSIGLSVAGGADTATVPVTITNVAPVLNTSGLASVNAGMPYTLNLSALDPGDDTILSWTISWGDGSVDVIAGAPSSATHTYTRSGFTFDILVSATDEDGTVAQNDLVVPSYDGDAVFRYSATSGSFVHTQAATTSPIEALVGPDGSLYVSGDGSDDVLRFDGSTDAFIGTFVAAGSGGLNGAEGMAFGPDGNLYVSSYNTNNVMRFDGSTGAFIDIFATGVADPYDIVFGPDSNLYVGSYTSDNIFRFNGTSGAAMGSFTTGPSGLDTPEQMAFGPDGNLYVTSYGSDQVLRFNGSTGVFIDVFVDAGGPENLDQPSGLAFGPDGNLYVADLLDNLVLRYNGSTGAFIDQYVTPGSGGLTNPAPMTFVGVTRVLVN